MFLSLVLYRAKTLLTNEFHILFTEAGFSMQGILDIGKDGEKQRKDMLYDLVHFHILLKSSNK